MTTSTPNILTTDIKTAPGVSISQEQKTTIGSVLDLFKGEATKEKLALWTDEGIFQDPLTDAHGRKQFEAQWYGLKAAFSKIETLEHVVTDAGNPIKLDLKNMYTVKGLGKETTIDSKIEIYTTPSGQIEKVLDKWNGSIPEGAIASAFRRLNAKTVPGFVSVPKDAAEEEAQKKA